MNPTPAHPAYAVHLDPDLPTERGLDQLIAWGPTLGPTAIFSGLTAAKFHGLWLPNLPEDLPFFVAQATSARCSRRPQFHVVRHPTTPAHVRIRDTRIATVPETLLATATVLGLLDQVVLIDSALHQGLCTRAELEVIAAQRRRGGRALRTALAFADGRSESAWETMLRMLHVSCGIAVTPQVELRDDEGRFIARVDLVVDATGDIQEYDGAGHREAAVLRKDLARERRLADIGRTRRAWTASDLLYRPDGILAPIARSLGTTISASPWRTMLADSLYTEAGRQAFAGRLRRPLKWVEKVTDLPVGSTFRPT